MILDTVKWSVRWENVGEIFGMIFTSGLIAKDGVISKPCHAHPPGIGCLFQKKHVDKECFSLILRFSWNVNVYTEESLVSFLM